MCENGFPADMPVTIIVRHLLSVALPRILHERIATLAPQLCDLDGIEPHVLKRWGELSESEGNIVAREVGLAARGAIAEQLHGGTLLQ